jgi:hypothetical protein
MMYEYLVVEQRLGSPKDFQDDLNEQAALGWRYVGVSTIGPVPSRWIVFEKQKIGLGHSGT